MSDQYKWEVDLRTPYTELERFQQDRLMRIVIRAVLIMTLVVMFPYGYLAIRAGLWQGIVVNVLDVLLLVDLFFASRLLQRGFIQRSAYVLLPFLMLVIVASGLITD